MNTVIPRHLARPKEPGLVTVLRFSQDPLFGAARYFQTYGDTFTTRLFGQRMIMTRDPDWMSEVLVGKAQHFNKDKTTKGLSRFLGNGLLTSDGPTWLQHRRAFSPHFRPQELARYLPTFAAEARAEVEGWPASGPIDIQRAMARLTMRVTLKTIFGADPDEFSSFEQIMEAAMEYLEGVAGTQTPLPTWIPTRTNRNFLAARAELRQRFFAIIESARRVGRSDTLLAQMLSERDAQALTDEQVIDESITMLVGGHDTSSLTLCCTLHLLARHPLAQSKLRQELLSEGVPTTVKQCQRPGALRNILTESLRLYPVTWAVGREAKEDLKIAGVQVRRGTQVYIHQWQAHRHPRYFKQPEDFQPDRWTDEYRKSLPKHLYSPFGAGPRICIGMHFALAEMSILLGELAQKFEFTCDSPAPLTFRASLTARPREPVVLGVRRL